MESRIVTRADIVATLQAWQRGELKAEQVWAWAEARFVPGDTEYNDWEGDSSVANEVLCELDSLPMNLVLAEDIPVHLDFLATSAGRFEEGYRRWREALSAIDWKARQRSLRSESPYGRFCG